MAIRNYLFANIGRDKGPKSSNWIDEQSVKALRERTPDEECAVFLCEINEGDDNNEFSILREYYPGWTLYGRTTREPILLSPDQPVAQDVVYWVDKSSVRLWSPRRSVLVVNLADEPEALIGCHPPAGANGQGDRPKWARPLLQTSWDQTVDKLARVKRGLHARGKNVTTMIDANAYSKKVYKLLPGERIVWQDDTDWGRVWPGPAFRPAFEYRGTIDLKIDSHDGHKMKGRYIRR